MNARIIPARAGFTRRARWRCSRRRDHPRSRGVYLLGHGPARPSSGSSPLARGLRPPLEILRGYFRIIPARAGFTCIIIGTTLGMRDHPRSRGVYSSHSLNCISDMGSSPLARGLRCFVVYCTVCCGIIPARAGFTSEISDSIFSSRDHPRSRGVYMQMYEEAANVEGSSPLARGLPVDRYQDKTRVRIIPARAGFTSRT